MKLIILKDNLKEALEIIGRATSSNINLPVLQNVLLKAQSNEIKISATNLELAITKTISGKIIDDGGVTVPFLVLSNLVNNLASERINLETTGHNLSIQTDNYKALIQGISEADFPIIPKINKGKEFIELPTSALKNALGKAVIAAGSSEIRPEINGVLLVSETSVVKFVATDSFRLAEARISGGQLKNTFEQGFKAILPLKTAQEVSRITKGEGNTKIFFDKNQAHFEIDGAEVTSRLIEGVFPDYEAIVPKSVDTEILVERDEVINSLKLASSFSGKVNEVKLRTKDKKVLEVYSSDSALGENNYLIPAKISGEQTEIVFNWRFLLEGIKSGSSKEVFLGLNGNNKPAVIKSPEDTSCFYILMPVRSG